MEEPLLNTSLRLVGLDCEPKVVYERELPPVDKHALSRRHAAEELELGREVEDDKERFCAHNSSSSSSSSSSHFTLTLQRADLGAHIVYLV